MDRVISTIEFEPLDPSRWRPQLQTLLQRMHEALADHPGIAAITLADSPTSKSVLRLTENLLGILLAGGLDSQDAAWACDVFVMLVMGAAREDDVRHPSGRSGDGRPKNVDELYQTFAGLPTDRFPLLTAHAALMVTGTGQERFRFAIDVVVDGMLVRAARR